MAGELHERMAGRNFAGAWETPVPVTRTACLQNLAVVEMMALQAISATAGPRAYKGFERGEALMTVQKLKL